jgi:hypothetical protein
MSNSSKSPHERLEIKALRDQDAALAMQEYEAEQLAVLAKTARLRAARLAKEAGAPPQTQTKSKTKAPR